MGRFVYASWAIKGHVKVQITRTGVYNGVVNGIFFDPVGSGSTVTYLPQAQMTATATSVASGYEASKALDGNNGTFWHDDFTCGNARRPYRNQSPWRWEGLYIDDPLFASTRLYDGTISAYNVYVTYLSTEAGRRDATERRQV